MKKPAASRLPTILLADCSEKEKVILALRQNGVWESQDYPVRAQDLQVCLVKFLKKLRLKLADVELLALLKNEGSLTGNRIGAAALNTLAWLENKKIVVIEAQTIEEAQKILDQNKRIRSRTAISVG